MAKVTINKPPAPAEVPAAAAAPQDMTITDALGRRIKLAKPDILAQYDLVAALGDLAANTTYLQMVTPVTYVESINDEPFHLQYSKAGIRAAIKILGDEGITAVVDGMVALFTDRPEDEFRAAVKN